MLNLVKTQQELYQTVWTNLEHYGDYSPGERYLPLFLDMAQPQRGSEVLDAGCGSGKGAVALRAAGFEPTMCDITHEGLVPETEGITFLPACLWQDLRGLEADWVYCCDVLEHIPMPFTMLVVSRLLEVARRGVFLSIGLAPDQFGVWVGEPLHQTVQSFIDWRDQLGTLAPLIEARDLLHTGVYLLGVNRAE